MQNTFNKPGFHSENMEQQLDIPSPLFKLPEFLIENIISHIPNRWNISRTCGLLYEIVCRVEKFKHIIKIEGSRVTDDSIRLTLDEDSTFDSIMKTCRLFNTIKIYLEPTEFLFLTPKLHKRQLERLIAIHKKFEANITSIMWNGVQLTVDDTVKLLQSVPKLESLKFVLGKISGQPTNLTTSMPQLKTLNILMVPGFFKMANLLPDNSLIKCIIFTNDEALQLCRDLLMKQQSLKSLNIWYPIDPTFIKHLQLEELGLNRFQYPNDRLCEVLKCQPGLKAIAFEEPISGNSFQWICKNFKQLEKLEVYVRWQDKNCLTHLRDLKNLQCFKTILCDISHLYDVKSDSLTSLKISDTDYLDLIANIYRADFSVLLQNFPNLTELKLPLDEIQQLYSILSHFKNLTKFNSWIENPCSHRFNKQRYPNMKHLALINELKEGNMSMIVDVVQAMPNLEYLSINISMMFNSNFMEEFINKSKSLKCFQMIMFTLDDDFVIGDRFFKMLRRLDNQLDSYRIVFNTTRGMMYLQILIGVLSKEFNVSICKSYSSPSLSLCKGEREGYAKYAIYMASSKYLILKNVIKN